ncbi:MAG: patatin-like phospholipase family protein [Saprospiraceae bacterium]|nr:patatin-like phospholipase family protein [Saprospiraceae bacterium]
MPDLNFENLDNHSNTELIESAQRWLHNEYLPVDAVKKLAKELENRRQFSFSRRLYEQLLGDDSSRWDQDLVKNLARSTYKDDELPSDRRFDSAANILIGCFLPDATGKGFDLNKFDPARLKDQEVLGQLGSIYKRKWKFGSQLADLYRSLEFYETGYHLWRSHKHYDQFYTGINAAFVYDLLAVTLERMISPFGKTGKTAAEFRAKADEIRQAICVEQENRLSPTQFKYWEAVTLAEAYIGLGQPAQATTWLQRALEPQPPHPKENRKPKSWEMEATVLQLAELAQMKFASQEAVYNELLMAIEAFLASQNPDRHDSNKQVKPLFGENLNRKIGLALSGGGFRASLFHIGVLARLAELDLLRQVQVISCVSGGSIIGAYYYLELQKLLESKPDHEIGAGDYVQLVKRIEREFLARISGNLRIQALSNPWFNLRIALFPKYTRTTRLADLYEKELYAPVFDFKARAEKQKRNPGGSDMDRRLDIAPDDPHIYMDDLRITPKREAGDTSGFNPKRDNWKRINKVPALILNATSLNTGHNWQFTASYMGEAPGSINKELSAMYVFRRMYYWEAPPKYRKIRLADAVGASACVPALFAPVRFDGLYPDKTVQLVDGGVYDNQGINALLEAECDTLIVSDASGQLTGAATPPSNELGVFFRSDLILQERLRDSQFRALFNRAASGAIKGFLLMHLTKGLKSESLEWERCTDLYPADSQLESQAKNQLYTPYGIRSSIQERLALIRTDLDAFHPAEAYALMHSGYAMTSTEYSQKSSTGAFPDVAEVKPQEDWLFLNMEEYNRDDDKTAGLEKLLNTSAEIILKPFAVSQRVRWVSGTIGGVILAGLLWWLSPNGAEVGMGLAILLGIGLLLYTGFYRLLFRVGGTIVLLVFMSLATLPHLLYKWLLNRAYLKSGEIRIKKPPVA